MLDGDKMAQRNNVSIRRLARRWSAQPTMMDVLGNNQMHQALFGQHTDELAMLRAGRGQLQSGFRTQLTGIREQREQDLSSAAGAAVERGALGSSVDVQTRNDVRRSALLAKSGARTERNQGLLQNWAQVMQSRRTYEMGVLGLAQQRAAQQAAGNVTNLIENIIKEMGSGPNGQGGNVPQLTNREVRQRIGNKRETIQELLGGLDLTMGEDRSDTIERLRRLWRQRNALRGRLDLDPLAMRRLNSLIQRAVNDQEGNPGGGYGGEA